MRVLINPTYWIGDISGHSLSISAINTAKALSLYSKHRVILPIPDGDKWLYAEDTFEGIDEIVPIPWTHKYSTNFPSEEWWKKFNTSTGSVYYDMVIDCNSRIALQLDNMGRVGSLPKRAFHPGSISTPVVIRPLYPVSELAQDGHMHSYQLDTIAQAILPTMHLSPFQKRDAVECAREFVNFSHVKKMIDRNVVIPHPIKLSDIDFVQRKNVDEVRVMFQTSLAAVKNPGMIGDMFRRLNMMKKPVKMVASVPCPRSHVKGVEENMRERIKNELYEDTETYVKPSREKYTELLAGGDVFLALSRSESFGISYFEQLSAGQVGIYLGRPWNRGLLPEWYPFVCKDEEEVFARLLWVVDNLEEAQNMIKPIRKWIDENLSPQVVAKKMETYIEEQFKVQAEKDFKSLKSHWIVGVLEENLKKDKYTMKEIATIVQKNTKMGVNIFSGSTPWKHVVRRIMMVLGYVDTCESEVPVFVRK